MKLASTVWDKSLTVGLVSLLAAANIVGAAELTGMITDASGATVQAVALKLISLDRVVETVSDSAGQYRFPVIEPGSYQLEVASPGFSRQSIHLDLSAQGDRTSNVIRDVILQVAPTSESCGRPSSITYLPLQAPGPQLSGTLRTDDRKPRPVSGSKVTLWKEGASGPLLTRSDRRGVFRFDNLGAGYYSLRVKSTGYFDETLRVLVPRENDVRIEVSLGRQGVITICQ